MGNEIFIRSHGMDFTFLVVRMENIIILYE